MVRWTEIQVKCARAVRSGSRSRVQLASRLAACALLFGAARIATADVIFSDSFESGDARAFTTKLGNDSYVSSSCHSGKFCGQMTLQGGRNQQAAFWELDLNQTGSTFYVGAWWRFPVGFSFDGVPGLNDFGLEHKAVIIDDSNGIGRVLLNFRGAGSTPEVQTHFESLEPKGISQFTGVPFPADGRWHHLEMQIQRVPNRGHATIWVDGQVALDVDGDTCGSSCSPIVAVKFGAFSNQGAVKTQSFQLDDVVVAATRADALATAGSSAAATARSASAPLAAAPTAAPALNAAPAAAASAAPASTAPRRTARPGSFFLRSLRNRFRTQPPPSSN